MISIPGISQFLGCVPVGPLGWAQALGSTGAAVLAIAAAPHLLPAGRGGSQKPESETDVSSADPGANVQVLRPATTREAATREPGAATVWATV
jgi:hypothetical protein